ncbi:hypothetical protein BuS5_04040 (plasmid) [Desulfosarcina sp. BuS5]|uniref:type-F conjugative transfer system pilin assembly protein TrbC n=1 Tax=Desulfosarcina sp. BuS5 TaxID=933262 RepID=UPI0023783AAD|nr:type-F conjugative transfer system pilin assembly protein TrbC [Desulfosarcina sp. BuS5]WDN91068.1 hypothetical protein BuS5_04040 [Desulfosarcina sp. BuS5]
MVKFIFLLSFCLFLPGFYQASGQDQVSNQDESINIINNALDQSEKYEQIISAPNYLPDYKQEAAEKLKKLSKLVQSSALQKRIDQYKNILADKLIDPIYQADLNNKKNYSDFLLNPSERIYIFISSSMPVSTLRNYAGDIHVLGDPNISLVMRGFVNSMKYIAPTADFVKSIIFDDPDCIPSEKNECPAFNTSVVIDPLLFRRYKITAVPAIVYARGIEVMDSQGSEGKEENAKLSEAYLLYGDVSLGYALEQIYKKTNYKKINKIIKKLRGDFY